MASDSLPESDVYLNEIPNNHLEIIHFKVDQSIAFLSVLTDWISERPNGRIERNERFTMMQAFSLLSDLMEDAKKLLPEA